MKNKPLLSLGLMSGTSADGVDVALLRTDGERVIDFLGSDTLPYPDKLRNRLIEAACLEVHLMDLKVVEQAMTLQHVEAIWQLLADTNTPKSDVDLIGFHGHTIRHAPDQSITWQIGDASLLTEKTGIRVVSDFRRRDVAAGGQGAPLAPLYHAALMPTAVDYPVCVLNLGGVGNLTWMDGIHIIAGDTGPGCGLLDQWCVDKIECPFDRDGQLACRGTVQVHLVNQAMQHPFFARPFPKSADRYEFEQIDISSLNAADGAATLCAITAESVAQSVAFLPAAPNCWFLSGGGSRNPVLVRELSKRLTNVQPISVIGGRSDSLEAECFAWLAVRHLAGLPTSLPSVTGAIRPTIGGMLTSYEGH